MPLTGRSASDKDAEFFIPEHELIRPIAAGAYGEVWLARNAIGTLRAIKIVRRNQHASVETFDREFRGLQKFEPVSRNHENLVDILTLGLLPKNAGFYYVMELAECVPITKSQVANSKDAPVSESENCYVPRTLRAELKSRGALSADEGIVLALKLAGALSHLHAHGLVHRDVKPSNILFIDGEPKLADAGLVAPTDDARSLVGTTGYIAPEGPGSAGADIYALGKVLYEAAFGKDRHEFPALPADVAARSDHQRLLELNEILLKACATDARTRYASAEEMVTDLKALRSGVSIKRRRVLRKYIKNSAWFTSSAVLVALLALGLLYESKPSRLRDFVFKTTGTRNREAAGLFQNGMTAIRDETAEGYLRAIDWFQAAIALDPEFAEAWSKLALCWLSLDNKENTAPQICKPKARQAATKALALNNSLAEPHLVLATVLMTFEWDWIGTETELRRALRIDPGPQQQLAWASFLATTGRAKEALELTQQVMRSNPEWLSQDVSLAVYLFYTDRSDDAIAEINRYLEILPNSPSPRYYLAKILWTQRNYEQAMDEWERFHILVNNTGATEAAAHNAFREVGGGSAGINAYCEVWLDQIQRDAAKQKAGTWMPPMDWTWFYMLKGDMDNAFLWWNRGLDERQPLALTAIVEPFWKPLWDDPRYDAVLHRTGLDKYYPNRLHKRTQ